MALKRSVKQALVELGFAPNLQEAERLVLAQRVRVDDQLVRFAGDLITPDQTISITADKKYFSRAGEKLDAALEIFGVVVSEKVCADVGASTGGFTGVLLSKEAKKVYAIDVARGEIAWKLRSNPAVVLMEKTNARDLRALPEPIDLVTMDVSFISVALILPNVARWLVAEGQAIVLVKPQFEAPRELVEVGGVIKDKSTHLQVIRKFIKDAEMSGFRVNKLCRSPIEGTQGNREFLALLQRDGESVSDQIIFEVVELTP